MKKILAFDNTVYKFNILEDNISIDEELINSVLNEFKKPEVVNSKECSTDKGLEFGNCYSTFETSAQSFFDLKGTEKIMKFIKSKLIEVSLDLNFKNHKNSKLCIDWMNLFEYMSYAKIHSHLDEKNGFEERLVVVFYLLAPENSSKLLIIDDRSYNTPSAKKILGNFLDRRSPFEIPEEKIYPIEVTTGDVLIHKVQVPHAVSYHLDKKSPRISVVMEFKMN